MTTNTPRPTSDGEHTCYCPDFCSCETPPVKGGQGRSAESVEGDGRVVGLVILCAFFTVVGVFIGRVL